jgi:monoamine oxidase
MEQLAASIDPADPPARSPELDRRSTADVLDEFDLGEEMRWLMEERARIEFGVDPDRVSLLFHAWLIKLTEEQPWSETEVYRVQGGNDLLPRAFASRLGDRVLLRSPVTAFEAHRDRVEVHTGTETIVGHYAVMAVPLPALRSISFAPALPEPLRDAVASLQYGVATKTALQFDERFWRRLGYSGHTITDVPLGMTWEATSTQGGRGGILMAYAAAGEGARLDALDEPERLAAVQAQLELVYPGARNHLVASASAAWLSDPYSGGAYAAFAPGQVTRFWRALRAPVGRVYLAGEHTDVYASYMEGAVRSGRRVAREIAQASTSARVNRTTAVARNRAV